MIDLWTKRRVDNFTVGDGGRVGTGVVWGRWSGRGVVSVTVSGMTPLVLSEHNEGPRVVFWSTESKG